MPTVAIVEDFRRVENLRHQLDKALKEYAEHRQRHVYVKVREGVTELVPQYGGSCRWCNLMEREIRERGASDFLRPEIGGRLV